MSQTHAPAAPGEARFPVWNVDLAVAVGLALCVLAFHGLTGFKMLQDSGGDNDSLLRLVQIRALLDGQGWYDLQPYRMGLEGGFPLHWSRLVDLPIAILIMGGSLVGLSTSAAEAFALSAWPTLLFAAALFLIVDTVRGLGDGKAVLPAFVLGTAALYFTGEFEPGAIDHHNIQLVLVLAMLNRLCVGGDGMSAGLFAGLFAALSIAIGMETAPYVAVAGAGAALLFLLFGPSRSGLAAGFGASFFAGTALSFAGLVHPNAWARASCDALSLFQLAVATSGGLGLAVLASLPMLRASLIGRAAGLAALGALTLAIVILLFPQCLASPYADLDPRMRSLWLDHVVEAQSLFALLAARPFMVLAYYATPLLGIVVAVAAVGRRGWSAGLGLLIAMMAAAFAVSMWQVRGSTFSIPLATIALALWLGTLRADAAQRGSRLAPLVLAGGWLVSTNVVWALSGAVLATATGAPAPKDATSACYARSDYADFATLPGGTVLAVSNLGASIAAHTGHRALAGPYHRNQAGNLVTLDALMSEPEAARVLVRQHGIDYVAHCPGNAETGFLTSRAPEGLLALLVAGEAPDWLEQLSFGEENTALTVFAVRPAN